LKTNAEVSQQAFNDYQFYAAEMGGQLTIGVQQGCRYLSQMHIQRNWRDCDDWPDDHQQPLRPAVIPPAQPKPIDGGDVHLLT
jgi:hypothetical protein